MKTNHYIKNIFLLALIFSNISCQSQEYGKGIFNLETLSLSLNVDKFYKKSMEGSIRDINYVEKKTVNEYDLDWQGDKNKIVGIEYDVKSYSPNNIVAKFQRLSFSQLESFTTKNGDLMLISATGKISPKTVQNTIDNLTKIYKEPSVEIKEFSFFKSYHYTWVLNDRLIQIVSDKKIDFEQTKNNIISEEDKKEIRKIEENNLSETHLFICNKIYVDKLKGKLISGNWSDFK